MGLLWNYEGGCAKVWPGPGKREKFPSLSGPQHHGRKTEPVDKVRILPQAFPEAQPAELHVEVPENYGGNFPLYLTKVSLTKMYLTKVGCPPSESCLLLLPPVLLSLLALAHF